MQVCTKSVKYTKQIKKHTDSTLHLYTPLNNIMVLANIAHSISIIYSHIYCSSNVLYKMMHGYALLWMQLKDLSSV